MKRALLALAFISFSSAIFAQDAAKKVEDVIKFKEVRYNFGKIKQGTPVTHDFLFSNRC